MSSDGFGFTLGSTGPTIGSVGVGVGAGVTVTFSNVAFTVRFPSIAVVASNFGSHPVTLNPVFAVTSGAAFARSANVFPEPFNT